MGLNCCNSLDQSIETSKIDKTLFNQKDLGNLEWYKTFLPDHNKSKLLISVLKSKPIILLRARDSSFQRCL